MEKNELILEKLDRLERFFGGLLLFYTGYKPAYIYKLVHESKIPYSKSEAGGSKLFFSRKAIDSWLMGNRYKSTNESQIQAFNYTAKTTSKKKG